MQPQATAPDGTAVPSQNLAERVTSLESEGEHSFYRADSLEARLIALEKDNTALKQLLLGLSKTPEENR